MIRLRHATAEQRKLLLSLGTSLLTRIPGALGVLWFLPLLHSGLGTDEYAWLLAAMALGGAASFLSGGFNFLGRRLIGEAYSRHDQDGEADGFASLFLAQLTAFVCTLIIIGAYCWIEHASAAIFMVAALTALIPIVGQWDDVRAAYNELYVVAICMVVLQSASYATAFCVPAMSQNILLATLVLVGPYLLSSTISMVLLVHKRPYLLRGAPIAIWLVINRGVILALADGLMTATLSLSVVWLQATTVASTAAWYATIVRLFQIFLVPIILLLFPLSSYIRIRWHQKTVAQQRMFTKLTLWAGIGYGAVVSVALFGVSNLYIVWLLHLQAPVNVLHAAPVFLLFGAIIAYKTYSQIAYMVGDEPVHLSSWTTIAISTGVVFGAAASFAVDPMTAIGVYALVTGVATLLILSWNASRFIRNAQPG